MHTARIACTLGSVATKAVALLMHGTSAVAQDLPPTLEAIAARARESRQLPGLSVAVQLGERRLLAKGYGEADVENHLAATAETTYQIGSITRAFTAASVSVRIESVYGSHSTST